MSAPRRVTMVPSNLGVVTICPKQSRGRKAAIEKSQREERMGGESLELFAGGDGRSGFGENFLTHGMQNCFIGRGVGIRYLRLAKRSMGENHLSRSKELLLSSLL